MPRGLFRERGRGRGRGRHRGRGRDGPLPDVQEPREASASIVISDSSDDEDADLREAIKLSLAEAEINRNEDEALQRAIRESLHEVVTISSTSDGVVITSDESQEMGCDTTFRRGKTAVQRAASSREPDPSAGGSNEPNGVSSSNLPNSLSSSSPHDGALASMCTSSTPDVYQVVNILPKRNVNLNDPVEKKYRVAESHFCDRMGRDCEAKIQSIDVITNLELEKKFNDQKAAFASAGVPSAEILAYHACAVSNVGNILRENLQVKYARVHAYGRGIYFSEFPDISMGYGAGLLLCRILPGREFVSNNNASIPDGYHSKRAQPASGALSGGEITIIDNSDQILPSFVIHLQRPPSFPRRRRGKKTTKHAATEASNNPPADTARQELYQYSAEDQLQDARRRVTATSQQLLSNDQVAAKMRTMFESSLALHLNGQYMQACRAVKTHLYPHQMYALAWMCQRENQSKRDLGVQGGILADDMGLGKTLTILALIMTNFHDGRPLARPQPGFVRKLTKEVARYLPQTSNFAKSSGRTSVRDEERIMKAVGAKVRRGKATLNIDDLFKNLRGESDSASPPSNGGPRVRRRKDLKQKVKSSRPISLLEEYSNPSKTMSIEAELSKVDDSLLTDDEADEFDSMVRSSQSLSEKLGIESNSELLMRRDTGKKKKEGEKKFHFDDGLSDDEEYQNMSQEERNKRMKPDSYINCDGAFEQSDTDSDAGDTPTSTTETAGRKRKKSWNSSDDELPDVTGLEKDNGSNGTHTSCKTPVWGIEHSAMPTLTPNQRRNLLVPPNQPAVCGSRRRATLIITPASLISHWVLQIEEHIDPSVDLRVFVHHGACKALVSSELSDQDVVLTTYGTLMTEFNAQTHSPLLATKWLRVCLDEGHFIKNFRAKTSKAAVNLDAERKWIISGTPIQNNLNELWSLLYFLNMEPYASSNSLFKQQIENPIKYGHPNAVERLRTLIQAICLRRTKSDEVDGKPLVALPRKTVRLVELEFSREEQIVYEAYLSEGRQLIMRYLRRGTLLKNYAHVFAVMMRLRQLCCHRELLPVQWHNVQIGDLVQLAAREAAKAVKDAKETDEVKDEEEIERRLAIQLRDMIRAGMSDECSICLSEFDHPVITPCGHVYCRPCITQYIEAAKPPPAQCPLCRRHLFVNKLLEAAVDEEGDDDDANGKTNDPFHDIVVDVSSTKINAVLKELKGIERDFPDEKTVVVSQFTSLLSILQPLLDDEGMSWTRLDGGMSHRQRSSVVADFQSQSPESPKILLLSLRAGGVGLNLTAGSRLLLLDPAWNPSTEEQCFDRIHRLGQPKNVIITKFVMKSSIEQRMLEIQEKKKNLISGAFSQSEDQRRRQRIQDIRDIFDI